MENSLLPPLEVKLDPVVRRLREALLPGAELLGLRVEEVGEGIGAQRLAVEVVSFRLEAVAAWIELPRVDPQVGVGDDPWRIRPVREAAADLGDLLAGGGTEVELQTAFRMPGHHVERDGCRDPFRGRLGQRGRLRRRAARREQLLDARIAKEALVRLDLP